ncbi:hypothetical protein SLEP1_g12381 [Rubroshorea leprosula]|uniref:Uncharacterized protein n=1 Tax=Rubroshorea leprosula TaxID=152421 RepID=A0AAV5ILJ1_9ROSI|nr:hypothetical protein SLEP1_g12381 [Rubroshorea leprosula]
MAKAVCDYGVWVPIKVSSSSNNPWRSYMTCPLFDKWLNEQLISELRAKLDIEKMKLKELNDRIVESASEV